MGDRKNCVWMGAVALWLAGAGWAGAEVVFQSLSPGSEPPQWIRDLNQLSEEERRRRVENYRAPEPAKPARVAAGVMKREEPARTAPAPGPVVMPDPVRGEVARVRPVPVSELQLAAPVSRSAAGPVVSPVPEREPAPEQERIVEPPAAQQVGPEFRSRPEEEAARRFRWRNVFQNRPAPEPSQKTAPEPKAVKQRPPEPAKLRSTEKAMRKARSDRSVAEEKESSRPPAEEGSSNYRIRLSGAQRNMDIPVDDRIPEPSKAEQQKAAADDAADYPGGQRSVFGRRKDRAEEIEVEKDRGKLKKEVAAEKSKPRRGLFGRGRDKGGLASGGGVIETTLFGE